VNKIQKQKIFYNTEFLSQKDVWAYPGADEKTITDPSQNIPLTLYKQGTSNKLAMKY